jgi:hypothetical protein
VNLGVKRQVAQTTRGLLMLCLVAASVCACAAAPARAEECAGPAASRLVLTQGDLTQGEQSLAAGQYAQAILQFKQGLARLGDSYSRGSSLDDTGQRLALAAVEERNGRLKVAAHLLRHALATRASMDARNPGRLPHPPACPASH